MIEWLHRLLTAFDYLPLPPWRPSSERLYLSDEGRTLIATDGGTDFHTDRRLRHGGIGICGGGDSSWQYTSPLRGPAQMNGKAELIAAVLVAEAVQGQADLFPKGVEIIIDNQFACFACQALASGSRLRPATAHYPTFRRLQRVIRDMDKKDFFPSVGFPVTPRKVTDMMKSSSQRMIAILTRAPMHLPPEAKS